MKENESNVSALPGRSHVSNTSKVSSSPDPVERPPMIDISNKLHAMVDEFVSNLTSECESVVFHVSARGHKKVVGDSGPESPRAARPSNRTTQEVLSPLRRPSESHVPAKSSGIGKSHMECGKPSMLETNKKDRDSGKNASLEGVSHKEETRSVGTLQKKIVSTAEATQPHPPQDTASRGKIFHTVEILSSDHSSDDSFVAIVKSTKKKVFKPLSKKSEPSTSRVISAETGKRSTPTSPESSHVMNYSYEEDTQSLGSKNPPVETPFPKLSLPEDVGDDPEEEDPWVSVELNEAEPFTESHKKHERRNLKES
jgi:hypothetical protein